jgi:UDP-N-acetylmuramoyl-L-alanyl-D-glutamate--2,6-diaminopimelate ligase
MSEGDSLTRPLSALLAAGGLPAGDDDRPIAGVTADSREMRRGSLFVAIPGTEEDGHQFVDEAVEGGAAAIVSERDLGPREVPVIRVDDARRALARLAAAWYDHPAERLALVGITGSLGKTSVLTFLEATLEEAGVRVGAIGSEIVGMRVHDRFDVATPNTTPDPVTLHRGLRVMADSGARLAAMEVSSHAIDQDRVYGLQFTTGVFTNLVPLEHQDYHGTFDNYVATKCGFFDLVAPGAPLIVGADSPRLLQEAASRGRAVMRCGFDEDAEIRITDVAFTSKGTRFTLDIRAPLARAGGGALEPTAIPVETRLLGRPHLINSAFAAAAALTISDDVAAVQRGLAAIEPPHRRMELLEIQDLLVLDDTAGHPDSLDAVFDVAGQLPHRQMHVVAAIRGRRGPDINARLAATLAAQHARTPLASLIATDSSDTVGEADRVADEERQAFLDAARSGGAAIEHVPDLDDALARIIDRLEGGDLLVLVGAQGMRAGADLLRARLETA